MRYNAAKDKITAEEKAVEAERTKIADAWESVNELGYADNAASIILGITPGTLSKEAREAKIKREQELEDSATSFAQQLAQIDAQYEKESKLAAERGTTTSETGLSTNAKSLLTQITADMKATTATPENPAMANQTALSNAETKIQNALNYGMITESDAVMLAVTLGITIAPESGNPANVIAPTNTGGGSKW